MRVRINDGYDGAIRWRVFPLERKARFLTPAPENQVAFAGPNRIHGHHWLAGRLKIFVQRLYDKQRAPFERFIFDGRDYGPDNAGKLHKDRES